MSTKTTAGTLFYEQSFYGKRQLRLWVFITSVFLGIMVFLTLIGASIVWGNSISCRNTANNMGVEYRYSITTGCMVQVDGGRWVKLENYRYVESP